MGLSVRAPHFRDAVIGDRMLKLAPLDSATGVTFVCTASERTCWRIVSRCTVRIACISYMKKQIFLRGYGRLGIPVGIRYSIGVYTRIAFATALKP